MTVPARPLRCPYCGTHDRWRRTHRRLRINVTLNGEHIETDCYEYACRDCERVVLAVELETRRGQRP